MGFFGRVVGAIVIGSFIILLLSILNEINFPLFSGLLSDFGILLAILIIFGEICLVKL